MRLNLILYIDIALNWSNSNTLSDYLLLKLVTVCVISSSNNLYKIYLPILENSISLFVRTKVHVWLDI